MKTPFNHATTMRKLLLLFTAIATFVNVACENSISESIIVDQMVEISVVAEAEAEEEQLTKD